MPARPYNYNLSLKGHAQRKSNSTASANDSYRVITMAFMMRAFFGLLWHVYVLSEFRQETTYSLPIFSPSTISVRRFFLRRSTKRRRRRRGKAQKRLTEFLTRGLGGPINARQTQ